MPPAASTPHASSHGDVAAQRQGARRRGFWRRHDSHERGTLRSGERDLECHRQPQHRTRVVTRRRCCPTAWCLSQAVLTSTTLYRERGTLRYRPGICASGLAAANRDRDFPAATWKQPRADRLTFSRNLPSLRRERPGLIDQLPRSPTARHRQQPGRLSPGGSNSRLVRYRLYFDASQ